LGGTHSGAKERVMGMLIAIIVLPVLFVIVATYAVLRFAVLLVKLCFLPRA
jgi:hypothetical protein